MITGQITNIDDPSSITMTTWEISTDKAFKNIIASSKNDKVNLTSIVFDNVEVEYGREYYGRAFIFLRDRGWATIRNISVISRERDDNVSIKPHLPTIITSPTIKILNAQEEPVNLSSVPSTDLIFRIEDNATLGLGEIYSHHLFILDNEGNVIWRRLGVEEKDVRMSDLVLTGSKSYTLKVIANATTHEVSDASSITFIVEDGVESPIKLYFTHYFSKAVDVSRDLDFHIPFDIDIERYEIDFQLQDSVTNPIIYKAVVEKTNPLLTLRANLLRKGSTYKIRTFDGKVTTYTNVKVK